LTPELVVRDFARFNEFEGHDLGYVLASGGIKVFSHGLRAIRTVGISPMTDYLEAFKQSAAKLGIPFPEHMPDPWIDEYEIDYELAQQLDQVSGLLYDKYKPYAGMTAGGLDISVVNYLVDNISCLRTRKPHPSYPS
jgi:hypothetical protein